MIKQLIFILLLATPVAAQTQIEIPTNTATEAHDDKISVLDRSKELIQDMVYPTVIVSSRDGAGSGVIIKSQYVLTAKHCIPDDQQIRITAVHGLIEQTYNADVVSTGDGDNPTDDWAILRITLPSAPALLFSTEDKLMKVGLPIFSAKLPDFNKLSIEPFDSVYAVGFPLGSRAQRITEGVISPGDGKGGNHSAPIIIGNSGGPVYLKETHELIGINIRVMAAQGGFFGLPVPHTALFIPITSITEHIKELE